MNKTYVKWALIILAFLVVGYPLLVWYSDANITFDEVGLLELFPAFGIVAFTIMWLHIVGGVFRDKIDTVLNFQKFVDVSSLIVLVALVLHPALMFLALSSIGVGSAYDYVADGEEYLISIAIVAWLMFIGYDVLKKYKGKDLLDRHWQTIKLLSTIAFFLVLFHSLGVGRDLQDGSLRTIWIIYGITAAISTVYTYFYIPLIRDKNK